MSETEAPCEVCGRDTMAEPHNAFDSQCAKEGFWRLESELREAQQLLAGREELRQQAERALSAERTARRVLREALEEIEGLWRRQPRESRNMLLYAAHLARAALAAEPGEGPAAEVEVAPHEYEHREATRAYCYACGQPESHASHRAIRPEGHPRAAEGVATPVGCRWPAQHPTGCDCRRSAAEVKNEG